MSRKVIDTSSGLGRSYNVAPWGGRVGDSPTVSEPRTCQRCGHPKGCAARCCMNSAEPCILRAEAAQPIDVERLRTEFEAEFDDQWPEWMAEAWDRAVARLRASDTDHR